MALGLTPQEIVDSNQYPLLSKAEDWKRIQLSEVATVQNGYAFKSNFFDRDEGVPLIRIRDITKFTTEHKYKGKYDPEYVVNSGDILIGMDGDFTVSRWKGSNALLNQRVCRIKLFNEEFDEKFLFICLQPYLDAIHAETSSVTVKHLSSRTISQIPLPFPSIQVQKDIVAKIETLFSELDKGIESLLAARQQLKAYRQAVLKHAFEGKLTAQWREKNADKLKPPTPEIRECQGMVIPESWTVCCVQDVLALGPSNGRSVKDRDGGFPVLRLTALKNGRIDVSEYKNGNWCREEAEPYIAREGDFLLSRGNGSKHLVGRGGLVPEHTFEVAFPDTMVRLRVDHGLVHPDYFSLLWESRVIRQQIEASARTTAGIYKINQGHIKAFSIPFPGIDEQKEIVSRLQKTLSIVDKQESELTDTLASSEILRQSILKKAFSGQLVGESLSAA